MIVLIGNQKGGVGKTTLTILVANYLSIIHDKAVTVIDMDYQRTLEDEYLEAKRLENDELYEVIGSPLVHFKSMNKAVFSKNPQDIVVIDLPGKLDDDDLAVLFEEADLLICPYMYDKKTFGSTLLFSKVVKEINPDLPFVYVPMRVRTVVAWNNKDIIDDTIKEFGEIVPHIPEKAAIQRDLNTYEIPARMYPDILPTLDAIYNGFIEPYMKNIDKK